ncbi:MAG: nucleotidyltransferase [Planctomycetes bacterium]|nr:nucleotidyltransferase [Planctomycetota bacterium]
MTPELERTLLRAVEALDAMRLRYAVIGGLAFSAWAQPRATRDVDLYCELPPAQLDSLQAELEARGFHAPAVREDLARFGAFRCRSRQDGVFLDLFDAIGPLGQAILDRRRALPIEGRTLWLCTPEDLVVLKAFSQRERDFEDLTTLVARLGPTLDRPYIDRWAAKLDEGMGSDEVRERLRRARARARG